MRLLILIRSFQWEEATQGYPEGGVHLELVVTGSKFRVSIPKELEIKGYGKHRESGLVARTVMIWTITIMSYLKKNNNPYRNVQAANSLNIGRNCHIGLLQSSVKDQSGIRHVSPPDADITKGFEYGSAMPGRNFVDSANRLTLMRCASWLTVPSCLRPPI